MSPGVYIKNKIDFNDLSFTKLMYKKKFKIFSVKKNKIKK